MICTFKNISHSLKETVSSIRSSRTTPVSVVSALSEFESDSSLSELCIKTGRVLLEFEVFIELT